MIIHRYWSDYYHLSVGSCVLKTETVLMLKIYLNWLLGISLEGFMFEKVLCHITWSQTSYFVSYFSYAFKFHFKACRVQRLLWEITGFCFTLLVRILYKMDCYWYFELKMIFAASETVLLIYRMFNCRLTGHEI